MPRQRLIALNGNAGAFVDILASIPCRQLKFIEDEAVTPVGLQYKSPEDSFVATNVVAFLTEQSLGGISIPNMLRYPALGALIGFPSQNGTGNFNSTAAVKVLSARSNAAGGTTLRFTEYE